MTRVALLAAACLFACAAPASAAGPPELPLGSPSLTETRSSQALVPGVVHTRIVRTGVGS